MPGVPRWRRPEIELDSKRFTVANRSDLTGLSQGALSKESNGAFEEGGAGLVKLFDVTRGLPQRIEGLFGACRKNTNSLL